MSDALLQTAPTSSDVVAAAAVAIRRHRFVFSSERELQDGLAAVFARAGLRFTREAPLGASRDRLDFLLEPEVGIEVKTHGSLAAVTRQLHRYAAWDGLAALVLVTSRLQLRNLPSTLGGKPLVVVDLLASAL